MVAQYLSSGNFSARSPLTGNDEIGVLSKTMNQMAANIADNIRQLQLQKHQLESTRNELEDRVKSRTSELEIARDQALESVRVKSVFHANMSHELHTPLNVIIGYAEILREELHESADLEVTHDIEKIIFSSNHLLNLIGNILDLSKIESDEMQVFVERFNVIDLLHDCCETIATAVQANHNTLCIEAPQDEYFIQSDLTMLTQVMLNLLSNAAKFTKNGEIRVSLQIDSYASVPGCKLIVADNGIGMSEVQTNFIFREFVQADISTTREYGGTGLGLTLTKRYVELLGGQVSVESALDQGATFEVWIPKDYQLLQKVS